MPAPPKLRSALPLVACLWMAAPPALSAQDVLRVPGKTVEVIGLEEWTIPMLQDSLRRYADGVTLDSHACAGALREKLGFPAAAVMAFQTMGDTTEYVAVSVVEPADSARVRRVTVGMDTLVFRPGWEEAGSILRRSPRAFYGAVQGERDRSVPAFAAPDSVEVRRVWAFVDARRNEAGYREAAQVLASDPNYPDRLLAALVLAGAPAEDGLVQTLVRAMLDDADRVAQLAGDALVRAVEGGRPVDWTASAGDVHALLRGSNLFELDAIIDALLESRVGPRWAAAFLAGGGEAVLARMEAQSPRMRNGAHRLLVALRGEDLGRDPDAWRAWVASLRN